MKIDAAPFKVREGDEIDLERHLHANGTRIVKAFLHLSKDEQRRRLLARIDEPDKNWKFSAADIAERKFWDAYIHASLRPGFEHDQHSRQSCPWSATGRGRFGEDANDRFVILQFEKSGLG